MRESISDLASRHDVSFVSLKLIKTLYKNKQTALAGVAQWIEHWPAD